MAVTVIVNAGTFNIKQGTGVVRGLSCPVAGQTLQINDGPTSTAIVFTNGLQIVTTGTGEIDVDWI